VRWYVTEQLIPQPVHEGKEAYYDLEKTQLIERLKIIKLLQEKLSYELHHIKDIMKLYASSNAEQLLAMLETLVKEYPVYLKAGRLNSINSVIHNEFLTALEEGKIDPAKYSLLDLARKIKKWSFEEYDVYSQTDKRWVERYGK
jgi:DNA-binding transcriptional MerR regulator